MTFIVMSAGVLIIVSAVAAGTAVAASVLHRSALLGKEIATRRILGGRSAHIVCMFLTENVIGIAAGILAGVAVAIVVEQHHAHVVGGLIFSAVVVATIGMCGGWLAARHASKTPFATSGLFRTSPDRRGQS
jgi:ABC-type antimicrobial peptide transport system permease subunit